jgi:hypothetical protein
VRAELDLAPIVPGRLLCTLRIGVRRALEQRTGSLLVERRIGAGRQGEPSELASATGVFVHECA